MLREIPINHYPHHIGDYLKDTAHLDPLEDGIYRRMLDLYYTQEGPLDAAPVDLCRRLRLDQKKHGKTLIRLLYEFFELNDNETHWHHSRCDSEIAKYQAKSDANRKNGKAGGRPKRTEQEPKNNPSGFDDVTQPITQNNLNQNQNQNQNQEPETTPRVDSPSAGMPTAAGAMATELRLKGVSVASQHPTLLAWVKDGITIPAVLEAVEIARLSKPAPEPIPPNYLDRIIRNPPKKAEPAWWSSDQRILAKGSELKLTPRPGEEMVQFKERIQNAIARQKEAA